MARDGTSSILAASRIICRNVATFGTAKLALNTTPEFAIAVGALVVACHILESLDDHPGVADHSPPLGPEDTTGS